MSSLRIYGSHLSGYIFVINLDVELVVFCQAIGLIAICLGIGLSFVRV